MTLQYMESIVSVLCTIAGLMYCVFKYTDTPRPEFRYLIGFFIANFLGEYYRAIYVLVMRSGPDVFESVSYVGWDLAIVFLHLAVIINCRKDVKKFFHPLMLIPILTNVPLFFLFIGHDGIFKNLWQVGITTAIIVFCARNLIFYRKSSREERSFPLFSLLVIIYLVAKYVTWATDCFSWSSDAANPGTYFTFFASAVCVSFAYGAGKDFEKDIDGSMGSASTNRLRVLIHVLMSIVVTGGCVGGYFIAVWMKNKVSAENGLFNKGYVVAYLFVISAVLTLVVLTILYVTATHLRRFTQNKNTADDGKHSRFNLVFTVIVTLALMVFVVVYNNAILYNTSVVGVYEDGENKVKTTATDIENYLTVAETTMRVAADSVDLMIQNGNPKEDILKYLTDQTRVQAGYFEYFTGIYAFVDGIYMDGSGWAPPEDYDPEQRDWYKAAVEAGGEPVIVSPYVDAQTGRVVVTFAKKLSDSEGEGAPKNVVCLDLTVGRIRDITGQVNISGKGYGMIVNDDGFIIAHHDGEYSGKYISDLYGDELLESIRNTKDHRVDTRIGEDDCALFVSPVLSQWYAVIVVSDSELFEDTYFQLAINIMVSIITFFLISFFYFLGYKNERVYGRKVEEMNLQVVGALATAIDAKDTYTNGHSSRVAEYARMIAARAGYTKAEQDEIYMMGLLHDVGKIGVPDEVINKPTKLTPDEYEMIKKHPVVGGDILERIKERPKLAVGARWHHERYDGGGYPDGISGENIPEEARIIAVADAYDAMTSKRSYREVMTREKVRSEILEGMGTQFDPIFAGIMLRIIDEDKNYDLREE
ncbi:MAG: HD domain-containing protein [Lachnospiraceae bacterium]|nr:HD domain-containing protein [Lachnospiraceae bacterium]